MSRWSRKTAEEKEATKRRIEQNERKKINKWESGFANELYKQGVIPIMCPKCGWTFSKEYRIAEGKDKMGIMVDRLYGECINCKSYINRVIPNPLEDEGILFATAAGMLKERGRLTDDRKADKYVQSNRHRRR